MVQDKYNNCQTNIQTIQNNIQPIPQQQQDNQAELPPNPYILGTMDNICEHRMALYFPDKINTINHNNKCSNHFKENTRKYIYVLAMAPGKIKLTITLAGDQTL